MNKKQKKILTRIIITAILFIILKVALPEEYRYSFVFYLVPYIIIGYDIITKAIKGIIKGQVFDENFLMVVASLGAFILNDCDESVAVMLFYQIGEFFQSYAIRKSRKNISELMDIRPEHANIIKENDEIEVRDPANVQVGSIILVKVGEKIPLDGIIYQGDTSLNTSALTGEAKPKDVFVGDEVISGCINLTSPIQIKTTKTYDESTVSKVLDLIENATSNKSKSEDFISKFARYYTPVVCYSALILAILPPLINLIRGVDANLSTWVFRALTFLVISCPCALVISIPLTFFAGIGGASNQGILIKGSNYLEALSKSKYVVFDKTGTMTKGVFEVNGIHLNPISNERLLEYAALAEAYSNHPIGLSIRNAYGKELKKDKVESIKEFPGKGIKAIISSKNVLIGNELLMKENDIDFKPCNCVGTIVHVAIDGEYMGHILINDIIKPTSKKTIFDLKQLGIKKTVMLTGDLQAIALSIKEELKIDEMHSQLLPDQKVVYLEKVIEAKQPKEEVVFVGDGINDAPVIARADIGIAMGALGSDAAIEAADIVLMDDDPYKLVKAIKIAKKCMRIVYENIGFAIGVKTICLILSAFGISNMWMAIFADVGVMIIAVINAVRALNVKNI